MVIDRVESEGQILLQQRSAAAQKAAQISHSGRKTTEDMVAPFNLLAVNAAIEGPRRAT